MRPEVGRRGVAVDVIRSRLAALKPVEPAELSIALVGYQLRDGSDTVALAFRQFAFSDLVGGIQEPVRGPEIVFEQFV